VDIGMNGLGKDRPWWRVVLLVALAAAFILAVPSAPAVADPGDVGYQDFSYNSASPPSTPTGTKRAENHLWFNDGTWWADMWDTVSQDYHIFKLDTGTQTWSDTGTLIDPRVTSHQDVLWDGTHLYVASHTFVNDELPSATGGDSRLYRFSYNALSKTYSLDSGFPSQINAEKTETLVIDQDSTGKVWATWQQDNQIYVNSTQGSDLTWGTPFALPVNHSGGLTVDDNSSLVHFGSKIGVMWSNQNVGVDGFYFAVHNDGDLDSVWQPTESAALGDRVADDHISMKATSDGRVIVAVKTSNTDFHLPLTALLVRDTSGGWTSHNITLASKCPNRPTVLIDEANDTLHVLETGPAPPNFSCNTTGGAIYEKTSSLSSISFDDANSGALVMLDADSAALHNVTSTKQNVGPATGLAALAINATTKFYWHHFESLPPLPLPTNPAPAGSTGTLASGTAPPPPHADFKGTPTRGTASLAVHFTDTSTGGPPTKWSWNFGDGGTSTSRNPRHTYTQGGKYAVSLTVTDAYGGTDTETKPGYVTVKDFTLRASPTRRRVAQGDSRSYEITVTRKFRFRGTVHLNVTRLPRGASASFSPSSVTVPPSGSSTLTVDTTRSTRKGEYKLRITGRSGTLKRRITVTLVVMKASRAPSGCPQGQQRRGRAASLQTARSCSRSPQH
jgi:PKD repeat protein